MKLYILTQLPNLHFGEKQNNTTRKWYIHLRFISAAYTVMNTVSYVPQSIMKHNYELRLPSF